MTDLTSDDEQSIRRQLGDVERRLRLKIDDAEAKLIAEDRQLNERITNSYGAFSEDLQGLRNWIAEYLEPRFDRTNGEVRAVSRAVDRLAKLVEQIAEDVAAVRKSNGEDHTVAVATGRVGAGT